MNWQSFEEFFVAATGHPPYPFQRRLAETARLPEALHVPTGLGKTAGVSLSHVWRRQCHPDAAVRQSTPRRLVYCLPMRVLVEQTRDCVREYLFNLGLLRDEPSGAAPPDAVSVHVLMGGDQDDDALLYHPANQAIIVGTQDMLLSRALNRGYGMSRFRWPAAFGLLNNDCLWVFDEVQLMGAGLATSAQLAAFRERFGTFGHCQSLWLSATLQPSWLKTVDHSAPGDDGVRRLDADDLAQPAVSKRLQAVKTLHRWQGGELPTSRGYYRALAASALKSHEPGTLTLVVANTVPRAKDIYKALLKQVEKAKLPAAPLTLLIHSRFRPPDRVYQVAVLKVVAKVARALAGAAPGRDSRIEAQKEILDEMVAELSNTREAALDASMLRELVEKTAAGGCIVVATQCVEAGIDISARTLFTELAPWASLVQRFGRDNRFGEYEEAAVFWIDLCPAEGGNGSRGKPKLDGKMAAPYQDQEDELLKAREQLLALEGESVSPAALPDVPLPYAAQHVIRAKDIVDLFDTTPDLSGNDIDVSRFIRDGDELDVTVFWRSWGANAPPDDLPGPRRNELCPAPVNDARECSSDRGVWLWDHLGGHWLPCQPSHIRPGQVLLLRAADGGYSSTLGWEPASREPVLVLTAETRPPAGPEAVGSDDLTFEHDVWQTLVGHNDETVAQLEQLLTSLDDEIDTPARTVLRLAARYHDTGKGHEKFQETLLALLSEEEWQRRKTTIWAKSGGPRRHHLRKHFRHELASALAILQCSDGNGGSLAVLTAAERDLVAYLVAAHHGRVRLAIRALPSEQRPQFDRRFALGIWDGEPLPEIALGGGVVLPPVVLDLSPMELGMGSSGGRSWQARALALRDAPQFGPFRLCYLEMLLRAADGRASAAAKEGVNGPAI